MDVNFYKTLNERLLKAEKKLEELVAVKQEISSIRLAISNFAAAKRPSDDDVGDNGFFADCTVSKKAKLSFQSDDGCASVYTDGACENNGRKGAKAGIGVWWGDNHPYNVSKPVVGRATNNTAEIQACIAAIEIALANDVKALKIYTDSQFVINSITMWIKKWKLNNWKIASGAEVKNKEDFQKLDSLCSQLRRIEWEHVNGHVGIHGNEEADKLARNGALSYIS